MAQPAEHAFLQGRSISVSSPGSLGNGGREPLWPGLERNGPGKSNEIRTQPGARSESRA
jgi:hypothetical protein